jgi:long-subunit fatty acid transport protein
MVMLAGSFGSKPFAFAVSFASLTERTYDITTSAMDTVAGTEIAVDDRIRQDGGINDIRGAVGWRTSSKVQLGAAFHLITGSMRVRARREFVDTRLERYDEESQVSFSGVGVSAGVQWEASQRIHLAFSARLDSDMKTTVAERSKSSTSTTKIPLPFSLDGGVMVDLTPQVQWAVSGDWVSWSRAEGHLDEETRGVFDSWGVSTGLQYAALGGALPVRLGARYGTLPFSPSATEQPTEFILSGGLGTRIARGRLAVDFSVERLIREGANASERAWHLLVGITVRP